MTYELLLAYTIWIGFSALATVILVCSTMMLFNSFLFSMGFLVFAILVLFEILGIHSLADMKEREDALCLIYSVWCAALLAKGIIQAFIAYGKSLSKR